MTTEGPMLEGVAPIFVSDYYDIPLRGICKYQGETLFFIVAGDPESDPTQYSVYRLPKEQTDYFMFEKVEFERLVGTFWSYDLPFPERDWSGRPGWRSFYELPKRFDLEDELKRDEAELIGRFSWPVPPS